MTTLVRIEPSNGLAPCPHCFESSGYMARHYPHTWYEPGWSEPDPTRRCEVCEGTGYVDAEEATDDELFEAFDEAFDALCAA